MPVIGYGESHHIDRSAANKASSSSTPTNNFSNSPKAIFVRFSFFSMNSDANEFFPSSETGARSTAIDEQDLLFTRLRTNHQLATAQSILRE